MKSSNAARNRKAQTKVTDDGDTYMSSQRVGRRNTEDFEKKKIMDEMKRGIDKMDMQRLSHSRKMVNLSGA